MADLQTALHARLTGDASIGAAIGTRAYWTNVPQGAALPHVRMQTISDVRPQHMQGYHRARNTRLQVDVFAATYAQARSISERIIGLMAQPATVAGVRFGRCTAQGPIDMGEDTPDGFVHRLRTDLLAEHSIA